MAPQTLLLNQLTVGPHIRLAAELGEVKHFRWSPFNRKLGARAGVLIIQNIPSTANGQEAYTLGRTWSKCFLKGLLQNRKHHLVQFHKSRLAENTAWQI